MQEAIAHCTTRRNVTVIHPLGRDRQPQGMPKAVSPLLRLLMDELAGLGCWAGELTWFAARVDWVGLLEQWTHCFWQTSTATTLSWFGVNRLSPYRGCSPQQALSAVNVNSVVILFEAVKQKIWAVVVSWSS